MKKEKWLQPLVDQLYSSHSDRIIDVDNGHFSLNEEFLNELSSDFKLHVVESEIKLRKFITENKGNLVILFKLPSVSYIPFDIEEGFEVLYWNEGDINTNYQYKHKLPDGNQTIAESLILEIEIEDKINELELLLKSESIDWGSTGYIWSRLLYLIDKRRIDLQSSEDEGLNEKVEQIKVIESKIKLGFIKFIEEQYNQLFFQSYLYAPVTNDKVMPHLSNLSDGKKVVICFDGMGFQEWFCIKDYLLKNGSLEFRENSIFALLPTVTKISRRALFSGERVFGRLPEEGKGFKEYVKRKWPEGRDSSSCFFPNAKTEASDEYYEGKYVGMVITLVDRLIHQFKDMGNSKILLQNNLGLVLGNTEINKLIERFLQNNYRIFITSDHGSVWCEGMGLKQEKYLMEERAKRACLFPNKKLALEFLQKSDELIFFENKEIMGDSCAVFSPWRKMFGKKGQTEITHGGIHLEEVVVPFVEVMS